MTQVEMFGQIPRAGMFCPSCMAEGKETMVRLRRHIRDFWYNNEGVMVAEPFDEFWDSHGKLHLHYTYICFTKPLKPLDRIGNTLLPGEHEFTLPCPATDSCRWGRAPLPPPAPTAPGNGVVPPAAAVSAVPPSIPPPVIPVPPVIPPRTDDA